MKLLVVSGDFFSNKKSSCAVTLLGVNFRSQIFIGFITIWRLHNYEAHELIKEKEDKTCILTFRKQPMKLLKSFRNVCTNKNVISVADLKNPIIP